MGEVSNSDMQDFMDLFKKDRHEFQSLNEMGDLINQVNLI